MEKHSTAQKSSSDQVNEKDEHFITKSSSESRLWIGNLDSKFREFNLLKMVEKFGSLVEFDFLYHRSGPQNGQPRGYAFVTYKELDAARKAQKTLDGLEVFGRRLAVKWAHAQDETKFVTKPWSLPSILSISSKETSTTNTAKNISKEKKIAALEEQLKLLDQKGGEMNFTPDIGASSKPTSVTYNYIEQKPKTGTSSHGKYSNTHRQTSANKPYKKMRRK